MENTVRAERCSTRGMERDLRYIVRNVLFFFLPASESPAALHNHCPALPYLFMRKGLWRPTSLLEGRRLPVNPEMVRLLVGILSDVFS
jgi:hypothetical protein